MSGSNSPIFLVFFSLLFSCIFKSEEKKVERENLKIDKQMNEKTFSLFGYNLKRYKVLEKKIKDRDTFEAILNKHHISSKRVDEISRTVASDFNFKKMKVGKNYFLLLSNDTIEKAQIFIYQHDLLNYSIVDFSDTIFIKKETKKISIKTGKVFGVIESSLFKTLDEKNIDPLLANELSEIYAWTIDFFRLQKGDEFKVLYEKKYLDDSIYVGIKNVKAAYFRHSGKDFYAFNYNKDTLRNGGAYFDEKAKNLRRIFLKAPLKFGRISSRFKLSRNLSIYGKVKPHFGTDFSAPIGTPILTTADGRVIESRYKDGNGNYVKIRHNATYSTQYLHMKKRYVKVGSFVKQGEVIGTVGMTGYTTGPHVCYRFWKNGKQVNPLKHKLPPVSLMKEKEKQKFLMYIESIKEELDAI